MDLVAAVRASIEQHKARQSDREKRIACPHQSPSCLECYAAWIRDQRAAMHPDKAAELADTDRIDARIEAELEAGLDGMGRDR